MTFGVYVFGNACSLDVLIMRKTLSVLICFVLKSLLSDTEEVRPACFFVIFAWITFHRFIQK